jgi:hypothetical protein
MEVKTIVVEDNNSTKEDNKIKVEGIVAGDDSIIAEENRIAIEGRHCYNGGKKQH